LEIDDVVAELVVLGLNGFVVLVQKSIVTDLLLEFLDISFFPLSEGSLREKGEHQQVLKRQKQVLRDLDNDRQKAGRDRTGIIKATLDRPGAGRQYKDRLQCGAISNRLRACGSNANLLTHLRRSILSRSLTRAEFSLAVPFSSIIVVPVVTTCAGAHHARTGHGVVERVVWRCWAGGLHLVRITCVI
jgi:hypothetical protein